MIKEYQINVVGKTQGGADLAVAFVLGILATSKEGAAYRLVVQTCSAVGEPPMVDHCDKLNSDGVQLYEYDPAVDNAKTEDLMLTNNFEDELDAWFGAGNWVVI